MCSELADILIEHDRDSVLFDMDEDQLRSAPITLLADALGQAGLDLYRALHPICVHICQGVRYASAAWSVDIRVCVLSEVADILLEHDLDCVLFDNDQCELEAYDQDELKEILGGVAGRKLYHLLHPEDMYGDHGRWESSVEPGGAFVADRCFFSSFSSKVVVRRAQVWVPLPNSIARGPWLKSPQQNMVVPT